MSNLDKLKNCWDSYKKWENFEKCLILFKLEIKDNWSENEKKIY